MQFTKLSLTGFKSFVDPTELLIEPGLTGIVGPNGCGKSNLVEALQWVMGEASARRLRGGEMDDVIFGGTSSRPARNIATVALKLDNAEREGGGTLANADEIEVERRIERGKGSAYRVNGHEQRARDVQILFADAASGAQSSALISQGRIGWLINAKPAERRLLLEEAAGIGGLHARRREAEQRLTAAETNLTRLSDITENLATQIERLKKQARQAERYRRLTEQIRGREALMLYRHWHDQAARLKQCIDRLSQAEAKVGELQAQALAADTARDAARDRLPPLRTEASETAQATEKLIGSLGLLEAEEKRLDQLLREQRQRLNQIEQDLGREKQLGTEADAMSARLVAERAELTSQQAGEAVEQQQASSLLATAKSAVAELESAVATATALTGAREAERTALLRRIAGLEERWTKLRRTVAEASARLGELDLSRIPPERLGKAAADVTAAEAALVEARAAVEHAQQAVKTAQEEEQTARLAWQEAERRHVKLGAEIDGLRSVVAAGERKGSAPILDKISVEPGLEAALGAALGEDLMAALDASAAIHWAELPEEAEPPAALPEGAVPLAGSVEAPGRLQRRLRRIGIVADAATGKALQASLRPGQRLVTRDGAAWRWDGLTMAAGAPTAAATRLAQRNRLKALERQQRDSQAALTETQEAATQKRAALQAAQAAERAAQAAVQQAGQAIATARQAQANLLQQQTQAETRRGASAEALERAQAELAELDLQAAEAEAERTSLPDPSADRAELEQLRARLSEARQEESRHQREFDRLARDAAARRTRLAAIEAEMGAWRTRQASALDHIRLLDERRESLAAEAAALSERPAALAAERTALQSAIATARDVAAQAAEGLRAAEQLAAESERKQQSLAAQHAGAREDRVRAEAAHEQAIEARDAASARARENFECPAEQLPRVAGIPAEPPEASHAELEAQFDRAKRERDAIGPVNLMAESEMAEMSAELETIQTESADVSAAIAKLRQAIAQLNREGRERLTQAFDTVNEHFQSLFVRLFGGGHAHLEMIQDEADPFAGGLEIMASPPGKKLQALSLLSGGERALTALALVFAVFLTNPAPISVLDEVDAPLDDANVERFCQLVREIAERTGTRFLVITHHRVSMARMDRLYGVTMMEKGISRLVSVELGIAERLRQTA
ncbi:MAG TPA: chromosome segregation protein SMC [Aliidongia sp.]|nr:chromosome segregation protein SMC [Aliidongia sp.]